MLSVPAWKRDYALLKADPDRWERHKETVRRRQRERYQTDPDFREAHKAKNAEIQKAAHRDPVKWSKRMIVRLRHKCKKAGIPFNITADDIQIPEVCPVFGGAFVLGGTDGYKDWDSPSVDRVIPCLGYIKGNVRVISARANTIKNNASADELRALAAYIESSLAKGA